MTESTNLRRVASAFIKSVDPQTGLIKDPFPLSFVFQKTYPIWRADNLSYPLRMLEEGGYLQGARKAIYNIPTVPKTIDYDWKDWNWDKIQPFAARTVELDLTRSFAIKRRRTLLDMQALCNDYRVGNYASITGFIESLVKEFNTAAMLKQNTLAMEELILLAKDNGIEDININIEKGRTFTAYMAREFFFGKILDDLANMQKAFNQGQGYIGNKQVEYTLLISLNKFYICARAMGIQGSDEAYKDIITGVFGKIAGLKVVPVPYLENKFAVSEEEHNENGKITYKDIVTDFTEPHMILFHKDVFPYKFGEPLFFVDRIPTTDQQAFTYIQVYPKELKKQAQKDGQPNAYILPKFCKGYNLNVKFGDLDKPKEEVNLI